MKVLSKYTIGAEKFTPLSGSTEKVSTSESTVCLFRKTAEPCAAELPPLPSLEERTCLRITAKLAVSDCSEEKMDVFVSELIRGENIFRSAPVRSFVSHSQEKFRFVTLESALLLDPGEPFRLRITRSCGDEADTFEGASALAEIELEFSSLPAPAALVENTPGYNSWPMCQALGEKIVCVYSRGNKHNIFEPDRAVYARVSSDGGSSWEEETLVCNTPGRGDVPIGKGIDEEGNMLLWVRHSGDDGFRHRLYKSADGKKFESLCDMDLPPDLVQITDIFHLPGQGMAALCFGGSYGPYFNKYWGKVTSRDKGKSWQFTVIEKDLDNFNWPTEPSVVHLGGGKLLAVARTETHEHSTRTAQFQLTSADHGRTWQRTLTNITDVNISTPSMICDPETGLVRCYYFYRGRGVLLCRTAEAEAVFASPLSWPASEIVATGSCEVCEAGNVNAVRQGEHHILSYYSGAMPDTAVYVKVIKGK